MSQSEKKYTNIQIFKTVSALVGTLKYIFFVRHIEKTNSKDLDLDYKSFHLYNILLNQ